MNRRLQFGVFTDETSFLAAARACRRADLRILDAHTPYPVHGLDDLLQLRRSRLPWVTLCAGLFGLAAGFGLQYWASAADWPIDVGGKPWNSFPAFMPVAFELTILCAGLATVFAVIVRSGLRPGKLPAPQIEGVTDDRFALIVARSLDAPEWVDVEALLVRHGAAKTWEVIA